MTQNTDAPPEQAPSIQAAVAGHVFPQVPQCSVLVMRSKQSRSPQLSQLLVASRLSIHEAMQSMVSVASGSLIGICAPQPAPRSLLIRYELVESPGTIRTSPSQSAAS